MIEPTDEMLAAFLAAWDHENRVINDSAGEYVETGARDRAGLAAVLPLVERDLIARVEGKRDTGLCDCACDDEPVSPRTGLPMEHHCDCRAVTTAGVLLGDRRKTRHVAECTCDWDEP